MKQNDAFPSNYVKADDVHENETQVTIQKLTLETMKDRNGNEEQKPVVHFSDYEKSMVLNRTNWNRIVEMTGQEDSDNWAGKKIILYTEMVDAFGEIKPAVRVKLITGKDAEVQAFWAKARELGYNREEGLAMLKEHGNNFAEATKFLNTDELEF